jgi:hypothetical protein
MNFSYSCTAASMRVYEHSRGMLRYSGELLVHYSENADSESPVPSEDVCEKSTVAASGTSLTTKCASYRT